MAAARSSFGRAFLAFFFCVIENSISMMRNADNGSVVFFQSPSTEAEEREIVRVF